MVRLADHVAGTLAAGVAPANTRFFTLNEIVGAGGPLEALVNNSKWDGMRPGAGMGGMATPVSGGIPVGLAGFENYLTEFPLEGDTEVWEIANMTMDSHPIHLHAIQFQLINRQTFNMAAFMAAYDMAFPGGMFMPGYGPPLAYDGSDPLSGGKLGGNPDNAPYLAGLPMPPLGPEAGWKDTVIMHPGQITRIAVRWAPQHFAAGAAAGFDFTPNEGNGVYVWHCHITDHEDNEMMRPDWINPAPGAIRTYIQGVDY
jgi:FtsP/CotA-like multicopper oxidase with cupredoxin domain